MRRVPAASTITGVVSGEFDRIPDANDTFLELVGYSREDLLAGRLVWPELTPKEFARWTTLRMKKDCASGLARPSKKS